MPNPVRIALKVRTCFEAGELHFSAGASDVEIKTQRGEDSIVVTLSPGDRPVDDGSSGIRTVAITVETTRIVTGKPARAFRGLAHDEAPEGSSEAARSFLQTAQELEPEQSEPMPLPLSLMPDYMRTTAMEIVSQQSELASTILRLYRWRFQIKASQRPFMFKNCTFAVDDGPWKPLAVESRWMFGEPFVVTLSDPEKGSEIERLLSSKASLPVGHVLLSEAMDLQYQSPKSALTLGVAALEVGLKHLVTHIVPLATWLALEAPTPPVQRMLSEYLPELIQVANVKVANEGRLSKAVLDRVRDAVNERNQLAHQGRVSRDSAWLQGWLILCRDILYYFDCIEGQPWASQWIQEADIRNLVTVPESI